MSYGHFHWKTVLISDVVLDSDERVVLESLLGRRNSVSWQEFEQAIMKIRSRHLCEQDESFDVADLEAPEDPWFLEARVYTLQSALADATAKIRYRIPNLRDWAKGKPCQYRAPQFCMCNPADPETSVLCHVNRGMVRGKSQKVSDLTAFIGCSGCHGIFDEQIRQAVYSRQELDVMALEAIARTHELYRKEWGWR